MNMHTPGPMIVTFGGETCELHLAARGADTSAKTRVMRMVRSRNVKDDSNVRFVRTVSVAPDLLAIIEKALAAPVEQYSSVKQFQGWLALIAKPVLANIQP